MKTSSISKNDYESSYDYYLPYINMFKGHSAKYSKICDLRQWEVKITGL